MVEPTAGGKKHRPQYVKQCKACKKECRKNKGKGSKCGSTDCKEQCAKHRCKKNCKKVCKGQSGDSKKDCQNGDSLFEVAQEAGKEQSEGEAKKKGSGRADAEEDEEEEEEDEEEGEEDDPDSEDDDDNDNEGNNDEDNDNEGNNDENNDNEPSPSPPSSACSGGECDCLDKMVQHNKIVFQSGTNSYDGCLKECKKHDDCVAFDFTTHDGYSTACRGASAVEPRKDDDGGDADRKFCKIGSGSEGNNDED